MQEKLVALLSDPVVAGGIVYLLTAFLPSSRLTQVGDAVRKYTDKLPILGAVFNIGRLYVQRNMARAATAKVESAAQTAQVLVEGAEQLKKAGVLDSGTAAAQVTNDLVKMFQLDEPTARKVTERAVRSMNLQ